MKWKKINWQFLKYNFKSFFLQNLRENSFEIKQNLNWSKSARNKLANGHGGLIIQLRAAIFERIRNVQIQALQAVFICPLSLPFLCVRHLWLKCYRRQAVYNDVTRDSETCCLILHNVTGNRYLKYPVHFFCWIIFHSLSYEQNFSTNRIAGKLLNIKKIILFSNVFLL